MKVRRKNIFNKAVAMELNRRGHDILEIIPHREIPNFYLFAFEDTAALRRDLTSITNSKKEK